MKLSELSKLKETFKTMGDPLVWSPIQEDEEVLAEFELLVSKIEESKGWPKERNHEKGKLLEKLTGIVLNRFNVAEVHSDFSVQDNQIDHELEFIDLYVTNFTKEAGYKAVFECKNEKGKVDVSYMAKLIELCETRKANLGIFISMQGITGQGWIYAEGKRKKNFLRKGIAIIHFTIDEIKELKEKNFYTLMKLKFKMLVDEVDESLDDIEELQRYSKEEQSTLSARLINNLDQFKKFGLIENEDYEKIVAKVRDTYQE
ncbi:hypothetical protein COD13_29025 [Priestia megaterium]|uniref:restriction endonuclease n=1 Tax=Priestia megaterium TaxID=1404 RepID=UPI000BFE1701|nr:restriction endonuclease [Priestia megaterium]PGT49814.1 hypothetical protein COD13_29025 [Priestia megaterium]